MKLFTLPLFKHRRFTGRIIFITLLLLFTGYTIWSIMEMNKQAAANLGIFHDK
jgi:hypothetical protein